MSQLRLIQGNTRQTSLEAYRKIIQDGLLSKRRMEVYVTLFHHGPATGNELLQHYITRYGRSGNSPIVTSRLSELRDSGVAREVTTRPCTITGHNAIVWDVTDGLPVKRIKKKVKTIDHVVGYMIENELAFISMEELLQIKGN